MNEMILLSPKAQRVCDELKQYADRQACKVDLPEPMEARNAYADAIYELSQIVSVLVSRTENTGPGWPSEDVLRAMQK